MPATGGTSTLASAELINKRWRAHVHGEQVRDVPSLKYPGAQGMHACDPVDGVPVFTGHVDVQDDESIDETWPVKESDNAGSTTVSHDNVSFYTLACTCWTLQARYAGYPWVRKVLSCWTNFGLAHLCLTRRPGIRYA